MALPLFNTLKAVLAERINQSFALERQHQMLLFEFRLELSTQLTTGLSAYQKKMALPEGRYDVKVHTQFSDGEMVVSVSSLVRLKRL